MQDTGEQAPLAEDDTLDARGSLCPIPVLKARKRLAKLQPGQVLRVLADDPAAIVDVPFFCDESGNDLVHQSVQGADQVYLIRKS